VARSDKLLNMKMPKKPMAEEELDADLAGEDLEMAEEEAGEAAELEGMMPEGEGLPELADIDDMALLEEAMARGLLPEDFEMPETAAAEEGMEDLEMDEEAELEDEEELY